MHPLNNGSQVENVPALKPRVGTPGYFSESNDNGAPSYPGQDWFNAVIREFQTALSASGVAFDPDKFDHLQKMITNASNGARNLFEANQNFNVEGADGTLTSTNQTFTDGQEFSHGWTVTGGTNLVNVKLVNGEVTATSGKIQRAYPKDPAGLLKAASVYGSVTTKNGNQVYADTLLTNGIEVTEDSSHVYITIDFNVYNAGIAYVALCISRGSVLPISDLQSEREARGGYVIINGMKIFPDGGFEFSFSINTGQLNAGDAHDQQVVFPLSIDVSKNFQLSSVSYSGASTTDASLINAYTAVLTSGSIRLGGRNVTAFNQSVGTQVSATLRGTLL